MLNCETNTRTMEAAILRAAAGSCGKRKDLQSDFEHGQWWITNTRTGAQWSVCDTNNGFDFEQVTKGDDD